MSIFANLMSKIFGAGENVAPPTSPVPTTVTPNLGATPAAAATAVVNVESVLEGLAAKNPEKLNWRTSIVDLLKLVGMDSSLAKRQELAKELGFTGKLDDSAALNVWLHKAVLQKLADNGGQIPENLLR